MVMLSQLLRCTLTDTQDRQAPLFDLSVDPLEGDYPPVTDLFFRDSKRQTRSVPWVQVQSLDWQHQQIKVASFDDSKKWSTDSLAQKVLLSAGILDALILDLENRRATRANDLLLEEQESQLLLKAADTGFGAMLRRLTNGRFGEISQEALFDWKYVEFLRGDPTAVKSEAGHGLRIGRLPAAEIARLTDALPYLHAAELVTLLADPKAADTLEAMRAERQLQVFEELAEDQALRLLALMAPDNATDLVGRLQTKTMRRFLERLPRRRAELILDLLKYPDDTVGGIMTNDVVYVNGDLSVAQARDSLRTRLAEPDFAILIYVVDSERRLRGVVSLRELLTRKDDEVMGDVMDPFVTTLTPLEPADKSSYRVLNSHLPALPVVDGNKRLLGVVTMDVAMGQVSPRSWGAEPPRIFS